MPLYQVTNHVCTDSDYPRIHQQASIGSEYTSWLHGLHHELDFRQQQLEQCPSIQAPHVGPSIVVEPYLKLTRTHYVGML